MQRYIKFLMAGASALRSLGMRSRHQRAASRATGGGLFTARMAPWVTQGRDHFKAHGASYLKHAPLFLALWSVRRAHPVILAYTIGKTGLGLASDPKIRAAVMAATQKLRRR